MVRELKLQGCIRSMEPQAVFSVLFGDERFFKRYHKEQNGDAFADVSSWTDDGHRTVKFSATLNAPKVIKKVVGLDTLKVTELQTYSTIGGTFTIRSIPAVEHPQGFSTSVEMILGPADSGKGCLVSIAAILECKAAVWGVQGTIENFMERKAKKSFLGWLKLARLYCKEQVELVTGLPFIGKDEEDLLEAAASDDEFFDFSEEDEKALTLSGESRTLGLIYSREGEAGLQNWIMQSVMGQLNGLHITCDASRSHVEELNRRLQKMEENILIVQKQLQGGFYFPQNVVWGLVGTCVGTSLLFGAGLVYLRSHRSK